MLRILILSLVFSCGRLFADPWDLKSWDSAKPLKLTQGWEFFWETWLTPESPLAQGIQLDTELCWQRVINPSTQKTFPSEGFGTYKISFRALPPSTQPASSHAGLHGLARGHRRTFFRGA